MAIRTFNYKSAEAPGVGFGEAIKEEWGSFSPKLILFFVSSEFGVANPSAELQRAFPKTRVVGLTSQSEFYNNQFMLHSICAMGFDRESVSDVCIRVVTERKPRKEMRELLREMHRHFGGYDEILNDFSKYVGLVLFDGICDYEESFMDGLGMVTDVQFVGGTAASNEGQPSSVYCDGEVHRDAVILVIMKTVCGYQAFKTQSADLFCEQAYTVTRADMEERVIYELDGRPAMHVFSDALGVPIEKATDYFHINSVGVISGEEVFIRSPRARRGEGIELSCGIPAGARIYILKSGDVVADTKKDLERFISGNPAGIVQFNCFHRTMQLLQEDVMQPYCDLFGEYHHIGGATRGEAYLGYINKTSVILAIK